MLPGGSAAAAVRRQRRATLLLAHPVLGSHLCPCYSIKIHTSGNRTIGDRTSGGPPVYGIVTTFSTLTWEMFGAK